MKARLWMLCVTCLVSCNASATEYHAILVGVTDYPYLEENLSLTGPENDIVMVKSVLQEKGFAEDRMHTLTDASGRGPTRENIVNAFAQLRADIKAMQSASAKDHFVYLHFSGHGSQQPAPETSDELDGFDEIFLPKDVKGWDFNVGQVENAITDNEIGELITSIRETGAFVWAVFDTCHSGTMTRAAVDENVVMRKVDRCSLGVPGCDSGQLTGDTGFSVQSRGQSGQENTAASPTTTSTSPADDLGGLVAFYAAQSSESTPEMMIPRGIDKTHGLFTYMTMQSLLENSRLTYRQLAQAVVQKFNAHPWHRSRPLFEGTDLDRFVMDDDTQEMLQWPVSVNKDVITIPAGLLHGITVDSVMALFSEPNAPAEAAIGRVRVKKSDTASATLELIEPEADNSSAVEIKPGFYAQPVSRRASFRLNVAVHPASENEELLREVLEDDSDRAGGLIDPVSDTADADLVISANAGRIWFLDPGQDTPCALMTAERLDELYGDEDRQSLDVCKEAQQGIQLVYIDAAEDVDRLKTEFDQSVAKIAKVTGLLRLAGQVNLPATEIKSELLVARPGETLSLSADQVPVVQNGDKVSISVENVGRQFMDISVFFVGSDYSVIQVYPAAGESTRVEEKAKLKQEIGTVNVDTIGREHLVVVANPVNRDTVTSDNSFLQQSGLQSVVANSVTEGLRGARGMPGALQQLWDASKELGEIETATRGLSSSSGRAGGLTVFSWQTAL